MCRPFTSNKDFKAGVGFIFKATPSVTCSGALSWQLLKIEGSCSYIRGDFQKDNFKMAIFKPQASLSSSDSCQIVPCVAARPARD